MDNKTTTAVLHLSPHGKVGVGTNTMPGIYTLYVRGSMIMEEAFVVLQVNVPPEIPSHSERNDKA